MTPNNRFERSRGASSMSHGGVDDWDKSASLVVCAIPRRSTSSLEAITTRLSRFKKRNDQRHHK
jgi:hypothetical protein